MKLLDIDQSLVEEFALPADFELSLEDKKKFVMEQAEQVNKVVWRCRVELMALELAEAETPEQAAGKEQERLKLRAELKQYSTAVKSFLAIHNAL